MIIERNGKFYRQETTEKEISEIEFLREKIKELKEKINSPFIQPSPIVICPCPCPKREEYPNQYQPEPLLPEPYHYDLGRFTCGAVITGGHP